MPFPVATPGPETWLLVLFVCLAPLLVWLLAARAMPERTRNMPDAVRVGVPMFFGLAGAIFGVIGVWLVSANDAWIDDERLYLRASRLFLAEVALDRLRPEAAEPLALDALSPEGRVRAPGYAAGWYRDADSRRVFVLYAGRDMTRLPTDEAFDLAFTPVDTDALARLRRHP